jgi:hypothetical protein
MRTRSAAKRGLGSFGGASRHCAVAGGLASQYCRSAGDMALVTTLANIYSKKLSRPISAATEVRTGTVNLGALWIFRVVQVTISVGASEALFALLQSLVNPGMRRLLRAGHCCLRLRLHRLLLCAGPSQAMKLSFWSPHSTCIPRKPLWLVCIAVKSRRQVSHSPHFPGL